MPESTTAPLIHRDEEEEEEEEDDDVRDENVQAGRTFHVAVDESSLLAPTAFIWSLTLCAGVSGLLFGYDTGVISSTLVSIGSDLSARPLSTLDKSLITSCTSLLALVASPVTGVLADHWGRKTVILVADVLFVLGALWQAFTGSVWGMVGGRSVVGLAVGSASFVVPLYISELSPSPFRGRLVTISALFITGGQVIAYVIGWLFSSQPHGWRWMVGLGAVPAALQFLMLQFLPETPRWLVQANQMELAKKVLVRVYGNEEDMQELVSSILRRIEKEMYEEEDAVGERSSLQGAKHGWQAKLALVNDHCTQLLAVGGNRRALIIACMLQGFQQLCGFNSLMYFSATIFALVGFQSPTLTSLSIALTNFAFTLVAFKTIDRVGRRRILLVSVPVMVLGLVLSAVAFRYVDVPTHEVLVQRKEAVGANSKTWPVLIVISMIIYVAGYAIGLGNVPWQQSELFPLAVRSVGSGISTATNWGSNFLIGITFLPMMGKLTPTGTFSLYAALCVLGWFATWKIYPELGGLSLEDVGELLKDGWNVDESVRLARERKRRPTRRWGGDNRAST